MAFAPRRGTARHRRLRRAPSSPDRRRPASMQRETGRPPPRRGGRARPTIASTAMAAWSLSVDADVLCRERQSGSAVWLAVRRRPRPDGGAEDTGQPAATVTGVGHTAAIQRTPLVDRVAVGQAHRGDGLQQVEGQCPRLRRMLGRVAVGTDGARGDRPGHEGVAEGLPAAVPYWDLSRIPAPPPRAPTRCLR